MSREEAVELGQAYFYGEGRRKNFRKAFSLLLVGAEAGHIHCKNLVGFCYNKGLGVEKSVPQAMFWYERAAENDHQIALYNLALFYSQGRDGIAIDLLRAFTLMRRAAELGDEWAQCNLGVMYLEGEGVEQDYATGICWLRRAARQGDAKAQHNLGMAYWEGAVTAQNRRQGRVWLERAAAQGHRDAAAFLSAQPTRTRKKSEADTGSVSAS